MEITRIQRISSHTTKGIQFVRVRNPMASIAVQLMALTGGNLAKI
jgi:hypothetical protein